MSERISTMRLYASAIALVSGSYSVYLATTGPDMTSTAWLMLVLGVVVVGHGLVLLVPSAMRLRGVSGPLMLAYALAMLGMQAWMELDGGGGMGGGMPGMTDPPLADVGWDEGMIALAVLMLASGAIMIVRRGAMDANGRSMA